MIINKKNLQKRFTASLEAIGVTFVDYETRLDEEAYVAAGHDMENFDELAVLPGGDDFGICTCGADYVVKVLGEGGRYGFATENNPTSTDREIRICGGHDFAVIRGRFIVDPWYAMTVPGSQGVYDLKSAEDREQILSIYGEASCWKWYDPVQNECFAMNSPELPPERLVAYPALKPKQVVDNSPAP